MAEALERWLAEAVPARATDLHLDSLADGAVVRLRIDGSLRQVARLTPAEAGAICDELGRRLGLGAGQAVGSGRFRVGLAASSLEVRGSRSPSLHGPRYCLRLLDREHALPAWEAVFHRPANSAAMRRLLRRSSGLIVVAGSAGAGPALVAARLVAERAGEQLCAMSVEDPVEFDLDWVSQASADADQGLTSEVLLRAALSQDPDLLLVTDLSDPATARLAVQATAGGCLVIAVVPAADALGALAWLREAGVPAFALGAAFIGAVGVRLVRGVCGDCAAQVPPGSASAMMALELDGQLDTVTVGRGCQSCGDSGYRERVPVVEVVEATQALCDAIGRDAPTDVLEELAFSPNLPALRRQAAEMVARGLTTPEEAYRALYGVLG